MSGLGVGGFLVPNRAEAYQVVSTPEGILATVIYTEPINVRSGPSTVYYPIIGQLQPGEIVPALGVSPGHEWVEISFSESPNRVGWVYALFVSISGGELQIEEPPPTPTPLITSTVDPTLAAAFNIHPTQTRIPTFTPPPPLEIPQFSDLDTPRPSGLAFGIYIVALILIGAIGLAVSYALGK